MKRTLQHNFGKKILLSLLALVGLTIFNAGAQGVTGYLGATLGPQYTNIHSNDENFNGGIGYNAAISAEARFSQNIGLELQAGLSTLNSSVKYKDSIAYNDFVQRYDNNYTFNMSYLQMHLLFKYYVRLGTEPITPYDRPEGSGNYLYFIGGPYLGMISGSSPLNSMTHVGRTGSQTVQSHINNTPQDSGTKTTTQYTGTSTQEANDQNVIGPMDLGFTIGAGLSLRLSSSVNLDFSLRYSGGLATIDQPTTAFTDLNKTTNSTALIDNGLSLGHTVIIVDHVKNTASLSYSAATATNMFIAFNVGLKFKIFGDTY